MSFTLPQERARISYAQQHPLQHTFQVQATPTRSPQPPHPSSFSYQTHESSSSSSHTHPDGITPHSQVTTSNSTPQGIPTPITQPQGNEFIYHLQAASQGIPQGQATAQNQANQSLQQTQQLSQLVPTQTQPLPTSQSEQSQAKNGVESSSSPQTSTSNGLQILSPSVAASLVELDQSPITLIPGLTRAAMVPPPELSYPTFESLLHHANRFAFAHGYAMVIGRSKRKNRQGFKKVLLACDRGGLNKHPNLPTDETRKRKTTSRKTNCQFGIYAIEGPMEWKLQWRPDPNHCTHNHDPSKSVTEHPAARKLNSSAIAAVKALKDAGLSVQETVKQIQLAQPGALLLARDVYNARAALRREPERDAMIDPSIAPPQIYRRATMSAEERLRDDCRIEVVKAKEETERVRTDLTKQIDELKREMAEKDKIIHKFEMFIDICNQRVMVQRDRLTDEGSAASLDSSAA